jgi:hypothetical protein
MWKIDDQQWIRVTKEIENIHFSKLAALHLEGNDI